MSETSDTYQLPKRNAEVECIDPENIVIALPRRGGLTVSGGIRSVVAESTRPTASARADEETEPVLAD
jgi:hypothetical protein